MNETPDAEPTVADEQDLSPTDDLVNNPSLWRKFRASPMAQIFAGLFATLIIALTLAAIFAGDTATDDESTTDDVIAEIEEEATAEEDGTTSTFTFTTVPNREAAKAVVAKVFEGVRTELAAAIASDYSITIKSVDRFELDTGADMFRLHYTSTFSTEPYVTDQQWELTNALIGLWRNSTPEIMSVYSPGLDVNGRECSGEFMRRLADYRADRSAWDTECG